MNPIEMAEAGIWANHCMSIIIARETSEFMERELKRVLALFPEIDPELPENHGLHPV